MPTNRRGRRRHRSRSPLRDLRVARTLNQATMAKLLRVSQQAYALYEAGASIPELPTRVRIATILGTHPSLLWPEQLGE